MDRRLTRRVRICALVVTCLVAALPAAAQNPTSTVAGRVTDATGLPVPGVTVTAESPSLQGTQTTKTTTNGDYILPLLPPGRYVISFGREGFQPVKETRELAATDRVAVSPVLKPATVKDTVTVQPRTETFQSTVQSATNVNGKWLASLPTTRTLLAAVNLSPAAHSSGPSNNVTISGGMSFENLFLLNGVPIQDNSRHTPLSPFIEDAIQETTIASSGISAEYGRFSGGVVNTITRSGGNLTSATFRTTFNNDNWRTTTPFNEPKADSLVPTYEGTLGGAVMKDRLWYFVAGRSFDRTSANETGFTRIPYENDVREHRVEGKVTAAIGAGQRLQGSYTMLERHEINNAFQSPALVMDLASLTTRDLPQRLASVHYTGVVGSQLFLEAQVSQRTFQFKGDGGTSRDLIQGTLLQDLTTGARWFSPALCGVCTPFQERNSDDALVKAHYFLSTGHGSHTLVFGYDTFNDKLEGDNHQSGSDFQVWTAAGSIIQNNVAYPVLDNQFDTYILWFPVARTSEGTDFRTHGLFVNDQWQMNAHWSANLGLRWDKNRGRDSAGQLVARDSAISPRVGVAFDPRGDGAWTLTASYSQYISAIATTIGLSASPAGIPGALGYFYQGPTVNVTPGAPLVPSDVALQTLFNWFNANGGTNRPVFVADLPGVATTFAGSLKSPYAREVAAGVSHRVGSRTSVRADVVYRRFGDFYGEVVTPETGHVEARGQLFDRKLIENTNLVSREYAALHLQATGAVGSRLSYGVVYALSHLWGNFAGENAPSGPLTSTAPSYQEFVDPAWNNPAGDLPADQRHRARLWTTLHIGGGFSVGLVEQIESGSPYGATGNVRTGAYVNDPGYATPPDTVSYFFTARDAFRTPTMSRTDLSVNYAWRPSASRPGELFAQVQLLNVFNQFAAFNLAADAINTSVVTGVDDPSRYATFNPFTTTPVRGVNWETGAHFGQPISARAYTTPRTFQFAVGVRF